MLPSCAASTFIASAAVRLQGARLGAVQHQRQRARAEEVAVDFDLGQGVAELPHGGAGRVVDQHLLGLCLGRDVVDQRDALVEEVPAAGLDVAPHAVARRALPLETGDELAGHGDEICASMCANVWLGGSFIVSTLTAWSPTIRWSRWHSTAESATK